MLTHINRNVIEELRKLRLDLPHLRLLEIFAEGVGGKEEDTLSYQTLERKGYIVDEQITDMGLELYNTLKLLNGDEKATINPPKGVKTQLADEFEQFWSVYPSSNRFTMIDAAGRTKLFSGIQKKNLKKAECKELFLKMIISGKYTAQQIIDGTKNHIESAKQHSLKTGQNQLSFIANSLRYLREEMFEPFINCEVKETKSTFDNSVVDI